MSRMRYALMKRSSLLSASATVVCSPITSLNRFLNYSVRSLLRVQRLLRDILVLTKDSMVPTYFWWMVDKLVLYHQLVVLMAPTGGSTNLKTVCLPIGLRPKVVTWIALRESLLHMTTTRKEDSGRDTTWNANITPRGALVRSWHANTTVPIPTTLLTMHNL